MNVLIALCIMACIGLCAVVSYCVLRAAYILIDTVVTRVCHEMMMRPQNMYFR